MQNAVHWLVLDNGLCKALNGFLSGIRRLDFIAVPSILTTIDLVKKPCLIQSHVPVKISNLFKYVNQIEKEKTYYLI
jgi:hypothetical protein